MIIQDIYLENYDWCVRVYYAVTEYYINNILMDLLELECDKDVFFNVKSLMESHTKNVGFTYTNADKRESLILIGVTTDASEFQNTYDHEKGHLAIHISKALGINPYSEEYQYLTGEIGRQMFVEAHKLLCDDCRKHLII